MQGEIKVEECKALIARVRTGDVEASEVQAFIAGVQSDGSLRAELNKRTLKQLTTNVGGRKKATIVDTVHNQLLQALLPMDSMQWSPLDETFGEAVQRIVEGLTDADFQAYAASLELAKAENEKADENPETLEEFRKRKLYRGIEALTDDQLARWDDLEVEWHATQRAKHNNLKNVQGFSEEVVSEVAFSLATGHHDKKDCDLWIVQFEGRVPGEIFQEMKAKARQLEGWWSSYVKGKEGFQFLSPEHAEKFLALMKGDVDRSELLEKRQEEREESAAERLKSFADEHERAATESLAAPRQTNTARRAGIASSMEAQARADIHFAKLVRNVADVIESEKGVLRGVRYAVDVEELAGVLYRAKLDRQRHDIKALDNHPGGIDRRAMEDEIWNRPSGLADVRFVKYPTPSVWSDHVQSLGHHLKKVKGAKRLGQRLIQRADGSGDYVDFTSLAEIDELDLAYKKAKSTGWKCDWLDDKILEWKRFQRMGIYNLHELRAAVRRLIELRPEHVKADPVTQMVRALAGCNIPGFFATPDDVASKVAELAGVEPGDRVLEPSAGKGDLIDAVLAQCEDVEIHACEIDSRLRDILTAKGVDVVAFDFTDHEPEEKYQKIVMNPPFERGQDGEHVRRAFDMLAPGGRLVAIVCEGLFFRKDAKSVEFRDWLEWSDGYSEKLPQDAFSRGNAFRKTGVQSRIVVLEKPEKKDPEPPRNVGGSVQMFLF